MSRSRLRLLRLPSSSTRQRQKGFLFRFKKTGKFLLHSSAGEAPKRLVGERQSESNQGNLLLLSSVCLTRGGLRPTLRDSHSDFLRNYHQDSVIYCNTRNQRVSPCPFFLAFLLPTLSSSCAPPSYQALHGTAACIHPPLGKPWPCAAAIPPQLERGDLWRRL